MKSVVLALGAAAALGLAVPAAAQTVTKIKVAYVRSLPLIPHWHAEKMGYFKKEGIEAEAISLNTGPAVTSAVVSKSADVGFAAIIPMIAARSQKQPIKIFVSLNYEGHPKPHWTWMLASEKSGIKSLKQLEGRTLAINAVGANCELMMKTQFEKAGVAADKVKVVTVPFPQMAAALELGNADAACIIEPFRTAMVLAGKVKPTEISASLPDLERHKKLILDGYYATEEWLKGNEKQAAAFMRGLMAGYQDLKKNPAVYRKYLIDEFKMPEPLANAVPLLLDIDTMVATPAEYRPLIDAMNRVKMLPNPVTAEDLVHTVRP